MKYLFAVVLILMQFSLSSQNREITGIVFEDSNSNQIKDSNEHGLPNVVVSDQLNTCVTDKDGNFSLQTGDEFPFLFISMPSGYFGKFYDAKAPNMSFPLHKTESKKHFKFIHASDTHMDSLNLPRMKRFREMADSIGADFIVVSGDLIRDALRVSEETASNYYKLYVEEIEKFTMPVHSGVGNHELFGIERDKSFISEDHPLYGKKMYRHFLGPNYYSFNFGGVHFLSIDGVDYQDTYYYGGVDSLQLEWLENDLKHLSDNTPIVTFNHIPFISPGFSFSDFETSAYYGPQLLFQNSKIEHRHIVYNYAELKKRIGIRPHILALSGHYHAAQEAHLIGTNTLFAQTSAITRPDEFDYNGFTVRSGFTLYEMEGGKVISSTFISLDVR